MKKISIETILDKRLCLGCGACAYLGERYGVVMHDYPSVGRRPSLPIDIPNEIKREMAAVCPGACVEARPFPGQKRGPSSAEVLIGPTIGIWEGWASNKEIRFNGSSGGIISALSIYCIEQLGMAFVLHTGMSPEEPWLNKTIISRTRKELILNSGSRYSPSSPIEAISAIEKSDRPCVFVGKPCDAAAVDRLRKTNPALDKNLGLVLSFFCAGTPATSATIEVAKSLGVENMASISSLRYRGQGWPGLFNVAFGDGKHASLTYHEAWGLLARKTRQLRCHLCPDGLGELSDVSCGDAWHRKDEGTDGISVILSRTERGRDIIERAIRAGYIQVTESTAENVVRAQELTERRKVVRARVFGLKLLSLPFPSFPGFMLESASGQLHVLSRVRETLGMLRRAFRRGFFSPEPRK